MVLDETKRHAINPGVTSRSRATKTEPPKARDAAIVRLERRFLDLIALEPDPKAEAYSQAARMEGKGMLSDVPDPQATTEQTARLMFSENWTLREMETPLLREALHGETAGEMVSYLLPSHELL